jgi:hypothetical protein
LTNFQRQGIRVKSFEHIIVRERLRASLLAHRSSSFAIVADRSQSESLDLQFIR